MVISDWCSEVCTSYLGHPTPVSYGWPGGGAGRRRFSKADKDSNQARRVCQRADLPAASRITTSRLFNPSGAPPMAEPFEPLTIPLADGDGVIKLGAEFAPEHAGRSSELENGRASCR